MKPQLLLFDPSAWFCSADVRRMSLSQKAIYFDLLCYSWIHEGIKQEDIDKPWNLCKLLSIRYERFLSAWKKIRHKFVLVNGRYHNHRLEESREFLTSVKNGAPTHYKNGSDTHYKNGSVAKNSLPIYYQNGSESVVGAERYPDVSVPKERKKSIREISSASSGSYALTNVSENPESYARVRDPCVRTTQQATGSPPKQKPELTHVRFRNPAPGPFDGPGGGDDSVYLELKSSYQAKRGEAGNA